MSAICTSGAGSGLAPSRDHLASPAPWPAPDLGRSHRLMKARVLTGGEYASNAVYPSTQELKPHPGE